MKPARGYESLRRYRVTIPEASYFVTTCTDRRVTGLLDTDVAEPITAELKAMTADGGFSPRAWVIMPDHVHLFFRTTERLTVGQIIGRLKAKTRQQLSAHRLRWQGNFYEHRLRPDESADDVLRYMFLNPYRATLLPLTERYRWFWLCDSDAAWFLPSLNDARPFPEWLM